MNSPWGIVTPMSTELLGKTVYWTVTRPLWKYGLPGWLFGGTKDNTPTEVTPEARHGIVVSLPCPAGSVCVLLPDDTFLMLDEGTWRMRP